MNRTAKLTIIVLVMCLTLVFSLPAAAATAGEVSAAADKTAAYLIKNVPSPAYGSVGGEWSIFGLARGGVTLPSGYIAAWYADVEQVARDSKGVLHQRKYGEYSRTVLALTAAGYDPTTVAGYDLVQPLRDFSATTYSGLASAAYAVLALDSNAYGSEQLMKQYVDYILERQLADGGWDLSQQAADADMTAICLQALAGYQSRSDVKKAVDKGLTCLSALQNSSGSFEHGGQPTCESAAQVVVALCELGISVDDSRFVKNGKTVADALLSFGKSDGSFMHQSGEKAGLMATEQAYYALVALVRQQNGSASLYNIAADAAAFSDISNSAYKQQIETLAALGIIDGMGNGRFAPEATMTRAQYAAIVTRAVGLEKAQSTPFTDVKTGSWYYGYIGAAFENGIIKGKSATIFDPEGKITHEHAALMTSRAAQLLGSDWERADTDKTPITRGEVAALLYDMLADSGVLQ